MRFLNLAFFLQVTCLSVFGKELTLDMLEFPPMVVANNPNKGVVGQIVHEAIQNSGYTSKIYFMPARRAISTAATETDTLILPLARLKQRENDFTWVAPLVKVDRAFFSLVKPADSFKDAKKLYKTIAVSRGTAGSAILRANGFNEKQIVEVNKGESAPSMVLAKHADAWFNGVAEGGLVLKTMGADKKISHGEPVASSIHYLACSKKCDQQAVQKIRQTLKAMVNDGTFKKISATYPKTEGLELVTNFDY